MKDPTNLATFYSVFSLMIPAGRPVESNKDIVSKIISRPFPKDENISDIVCVGSVLIVASCVASSFV